jgi:hypothetical protein
MGAHALDVAEQLVSVARDPPLNSAQFTGSLIFFVFVYL